MMQKSTFIIKLLLIRWTNKNRRKKRNVKFIFKLYLIVWKLNISTYHEFKYEPDILGITLILWWSNYHNLIYGAEFRNIGRC